MGLVVILRHDVEALWLLMGSVLNVVLAKILKKVLNQDRPVSTFKSDPGMPSSHSQSIFFAATFFTVSSKFCTFISLLQPCSISSSNT